MRRGKGFGLIELLLLAAIIGFLSLGIRLYLSPKSAEAIFSEQQICDWTTDDLALMARGLATGTALTVYASGDSLILLMTEAGLIAFSSPAIGTTVTTVAISTVATLGAIQSFCLANRHGMEFYEFSVDQTAKSFEIIDHWFSDMISLKAK